MTNYFIILLPAILGYMTSIFCGPTKDAGNTVKFRPPGWVFGIVWPILYIMIGVAWSRSMEHTPLFILLQLLLNGWLISYGCMKNKVYSLYILYLSIVNVLHIIVSIKSSNRYLLVPLFVWLNFAALISSHEVQSSCR